MFERKFFSDEEVFIAEYKGQIVVMFVKQSPEILRLQSSFQQLVREIEESGKLRRVPVIRAALAGKREEGFWRVDVGEKGVVTVKVPKAVETMKVLKQKLEADTVKAPVFGKPLWKYEEEEKKGLFEFLQGEMLDKDCHRVRGQFQNFTAPVPIEQRQGDLRARERAKGMIDIVMQLRMVKDILKDGRKESGSDKEGVMAVVESMVEGLEKDVMPYAEFFLNEAVARRKFARIVATRNIAEKDKDIAEALRKAPITGKELFAEESEEKVKQAVNNPPPRRIETVKTSRGRTFVSRSGTFRSFRASGTRTGGVGGGLRAIGGPEGTSSTRVHLGRGVPGSRSFRSWGRTAYTTYRSRGGITDKAVAGPSII